MTSLFFGVEWVLFLLGYYTISISILLFTDSFFHQFGFLASFIFCGPEPKTKYWILVQLHTANTKLFKLGSKVSPTTDTATDQSFQMITFNIHDEADENQFIICKIKVCAASYNNKPTYNSQCPVTDYYSFSVTGYQA